MILFEGKMIGARVQKVGRRWGPYSASWDSKEYSIDVVSILCAYKGLNPTFLVIFGAKQDIQFICDVPEAVNNLFEQYNRCDKNSQDGKDKMKDLEDMIDKIFKKFVNGLNTI